MREIKKIPPFASLNIYPPVTYLMAVMGFLLKEFSARKFKSKKPSGFSDFYDKTKQLKRDIP